MYPFSSKHLPTLLESKVYFEPSQASMMEFFCKTSERLNAVSHFRKKSSIVDVVNRPLPVIESISAQSFLLLDECFCFWPIEKIYYIYCIYFYIYYTYYIRYIIIYVIIYYIYYYILL